MMTPKYLYRTDIPPDTPIIEGYIFLWGRIDQRDCYDTWVDRAKPPTMNLDLTPFPLLFEHNLAQDLARTRLGTVYEVWEDEKGIGYRAILDKFDTNDPMHRKAMNILKAGELYTSSGSAPHLSRFDDDGRFVDWGLAEVSLTTSPCETRMIAVSLVDNVPSTLVNPPQQSAEVLNARATLEVLPSEGQEPCPCSQRTWDDRIQEVTRHAIEHHKRRFTPTQ